MSDYDSFESGAESELGSFEEALEISGYDAVTTTQEGMRQDEFLKESGMAIDTVGDAKKVEEKREKREKNSESGIAAAFEAARHHVDNHKYEFRHGQISHGELKKFMGNEQDHIAQKLKSEKDPKKKAQLQNDMVMMQQMALHMQQNGKLTEEQQKQWDDYLDRNPDAAARFDKVSDKVVEHQAETKINNSLLESTSSKEGSEFCMQSDFSCVANDFDTEFVANSIVQQSNHQAETPAQEKQPEIRANNIAASQPMLSDFV